MDFHVDGIPKDLLESEQAIFFSRISFAYQDLKKNYSGKLGELFVRFGEEETAAKKPASTQAGEESSPECSLSAIEPKYKFQQLILPDEIIDNIRHKICLFQLRHLVFEEWGLNSIEPYPRSALNFYGPPGTGKTMAAHAIANFLNKKIILATYAEIESKYHGDGPKNVKAVFRKAEEEDAVLFIDEADSLLSQRLSNVTQGSEQAINSMRSQLLICLEKFSGLVIFSTNFVENYDKAFETRVSNIEFRMPDAACRERIWKQHLPERLPLKENVDVHLLADEIDDVCGRDIKNAVIDAALKAAYEKSYPIGIEELRDSINRIKNTRIKKKETRTELGGEPLSEEEKEKIKKKLEIAFEPDQETTK